MILYNYKKQDDIKLLRGSVRLAQSFRGFIFRKTETTISNLNKKMRNQDENVKRFVAKMHRRQKGLRLLRVELHRENTRRSLSSDLVVRHVW